MARPKLADGGLKKTVAFRLTEADHAAYETKFKASGLTQSEFFRRHVLANTTTVIAKPKASQDHRQLLYLANKTSNNINQVAHRLNADHLAGLISERVYLDILAQLQQMASVMKAAVDHVD